MYLWTLLSLYNVLDDVLKVEYSWGNHEIAPYLPVEIANSAYCIVVDISQNWNRNSFAATRYLRNCLWTLPIQRIVCKYVILFRQTKLKSLLLRFLGHPREKSNFLLLWMIVTCCWKIEFLRRHLIAEYICYHAFSKKELHLTCSWHLCAQ